MDRANPYQESGLECNKLVCWMMQIEAETGRIQALIVPQKKGISHHFVCSSAYATKFSLRQGWVIGDKDVPIKKEFKILCNMASGGCKGQEVMCL